MHPSYSRVSRISRHRIHRTNQDEPEFEKFHDGIFLSLITTLMPGEKRRSYDGKAFFRLVESKLGKRNAVEGKENANEQGNAVRRRVNHRRMYVSTLASRCDYSQSALSLRRTNGRGTSSSALLYHSTASRGLNIDVLFSCTKHDVIYTYLYIQTKKLYFLVFFRFLKNILSFFAVSTIYSYERKFFANSRILTIRKSTEK